ncbi:MAG: hypothetical protein PHX78_05880 [bacterium]|nr:hypothetical protein [bacterium]
MSLSCFENNIANQSIKTHQIVEKSDIVLIWPQEWQSNMGPQVNNCEDMAQWLNTAFNIMHSWTSVDPNVIYMKRNSVRDRLIFVYNGSNDFIFGNFRPYIGLRDGISPLLGTEDWFGWLLHELSHDFFHGNLFVDQKINNIDVWRDGMCDYSRYYLLLDLKMKKAADNFFKIITKNINLKNQWLEPARLFLKYEKDNGISGPKELWDKIKFVNFNNTIGRPTW